MNWAAPHNGNVRTGLQGAAVAPRAVHAHETWRRCTQRCCGGARSRGQLQEAHLGGHVPGLPHGVLVGGRQPWPGHGGAAGGAHDALRQQKVPEQARHQQVLRRPPRGSGPACCLRALCSGQTKWASCTAWQDCDPKPACAGGRLGDLAAAEMQACRRSLLCCCPETQHINGLQSCATHPRQKRASSAGASPAGAACCQQVSRLRSICTPGASAAAAPGGIASGTARGAACSRRWCR